MRPQTRNWSTCRTTPNHLTQTHVTHTHTIECATGECCDTTTCLFKPANLTCVYNEIVGEGYCDNGLCVPSSCSVYSNTKYAPCANLSTACGGVKCWSSYLNGSCSNASSFGLSNNKNNNARCYDEPSGIAGTCSNGTCYTGSPTPAVPSYLYGKSSACSVTCGKGTITRTVCIATMIYYC
jgi:hypothetical protein